ncbi:PIN domain-containing protein [Corticimicrobacter populi]|nr:PIN domain-containing protein [Corticimicrobacter populi]
MLSMSLTTPPVCVLDACVLMSGIVRPFLLRLADAGCLRPAWSPRIGEEWRRNATRIWQVEPQVLEQAWDDMQQQFPQALTPDPSQWESGLHYSDPKDWHVIAAARHIQDQLQQQSDTTDTLTWIITWNLKDFNRSELRRLGLRAMTPDMLMQALWPAHADAIIAALAQTPDDALTLGRTDTDLHAILKRERLFWLGGRLQP